MDFQELLQVGSRDALTFFYNELRKEIKIRGITDRETRYIASIPASYAQTSRYDPTSVPVFADLSEFFDYFIFQREELRDSESLEIAGAQSLFLIGFFGRQLRHRHNLKWYQGLCQSFYRKAGKRSRDADRQRLFWMVSDKVEFWSTTFHSLNSRLYVERFLLPPPSL